MIEIYKKSRINKIVYLKILKILKIHFYLLSVNKTFKKSFSLDINIIFNI